MPVAVVLVATVIAVPRATAAASWSTAVGGPAAAWAHVYCGWMHLGVCAWNGDVAVVSLRPHWKKMKRVLMQGPGVKAQGLRVSGDLRQHVGCEGVTGG